MTGSRWASVLAVLVIAAVAVMAFSGAALAQDDAGADVGERQMTLFDTIVAGGVIGFCIIFMNIVAMALSIEYFVTMRRDKLVPPDILGELEVLFEDEEYEEALELCEAEPTFFTNVVASGLPKLTSGYASMMEAAEAEGQAETYKLQTKVGYVSLICSIAPMMGLMGTVYGMIMAFQKIAITKGAPEPAQLADSIGLALVTTLLGLIVAVPFLVVAYFLKSRVTRLSLEVADAVEALFDRFRPVVR